MNSPRLNRPAAPTCREDCSRHASPRTGAPGTPRTVQFARAQQLKLLPIAYKTVRNAAPAHTARHRRSATNVTRIHAATRDINNGSSTYRETGAAAQEAR